MATIRTVDFLPEIFQTPVNKQFLSATLDQLVQEPKYKQTQGYIGQRVGPGVNPNDGYVFEATPDRKNYQLEPGVVSLDPVTGKYQDSITYPGILDAISVQGGYSARADRLFESEYYTWDPFVDFDKINNYSQYYWIPDGPPEVNVYATEVAPAGTYNVTRTTEGYTFSTYKGANPTLTLARNGPYQFNIAQNIAQTINYRVTNNGTSSWAIDYQNNPTLTLVRGNTYTWNLVQSLPLAFYIKTQESFGTTNLYTSGVTNNGATTGLVTFTVPYDAPDTLYYCNDVEFNLRGQMNIIDPAPGTGPKFWIQSEPGMNGKLSWSPNISSRDVLGVTNNGIDLGTVNFAVPAVNAQEFYYTLPYIGYPTATTGKIDLICSTLTYEQINGISVEQFLAANPTGIDGVTNLAGCTLVFATQPSDPTLGGWYNITPFDPLATGSDNQVGAYDTTLFAEATPIVNPEVQFGVWQIQYADDVNGVPFIKLNSIMPIANSTQFVVSLGEQYVNTQWYKNSVGAFEQMPLLTAIQDTLYYQDSEDPAMFGKINLVDINLTDTINVETDILGKQNYISPNGVEFTNGLKVTFTGNIYPLSYQNNTYYVYGVGSGITLTLASNLNTPEKYVGDNSTLDYMTISMASLDLNPWTRSNRWFHIDVINAAAKYNNIPPVYTGAQRARRPILEFRAGTRLFNFGTDGIPGVNVIDFTTTDPLLTVNGTTGYSYDGYTLVQGSLIIFGAASDINVRNQVYQVNFITVNIDQPAVIDLVPTSYSPVLVNQTTVCLSGLTGQGLSYNFDGEHWVETQQKTKVNQAPLFDVYNANGYSFGDKTIYPSTNFAGCKLLSYAEDATNVEDSVLGIPLAFYSLNNIGDILFDNNLYTDTFIYTPTGTGITVNVSSGFVRQYTDRITYDKEIGWQTAAIPSLPRQQFQFTYDNNPLQLDVLVTTSFGVTPVQVFVNNVYQLPSTYTLSVNSVTNTTVITPLVAYNTGDIVEVLAFSDTASTQGFYQVPVNLENNPFNGNSKQFTLGQIRQHYETICQNLVDFTGVINGPNNTRDLGNIIPYGQQMLQQSSPLTLAGYFLRSLNYNVFAAIEYNSREYIKYKNKLLTAVTQLNLQPAQSISSILDAAVQKITAVNNSNTPFYWSDMFPTGTNYTSNKTVVNPLTTQTFNTIQTYDFTESNYLGLLVYINGILLLRGIDYVVSVDAPKLTILVPLSVGDVVEINEYTTTIPNWCPNTPSKMGMYPKYTPAIFLDETYSEPTWCIRGHDGSITIAFGDIRDQVLLEFEKRIYNNIKVDDNPIPLTTDDVNPTFYPAQTTALLPGFFRTTPYSYEEINTILNESFVTWVGQNNVDYTAQVYDPNNPFTWNYSSASDRINLKPLLQGNWRGIYRYFYDTETPNLTPWEMVGFSEMPDWWEFRYGPAPYTSGNKVLWDDLEAGIVGDPAGPYILPEYTRPGLSRVIPVSSEGDLLPPTEALVGATSSYSYQKSWVAGDGGPTQASWWHSSSYPYAIMRMLALTKPAQFFSLYADRDLYRYDTTMGQFLYNGRYRLDANGIEIYGTGISKASYINWIVDYNQQLGVNSTANLTEALSNLDVRLCYRMASFSDPTYVELFTERAGPGSTNTGLGIPPNSYDLVFYRNQPYLEITYSSVVVEIVQLESGGIGYSVYGYSSVQPYFETLVSSPVGLQQTITSGGVSVQVPKQYTANTEQIPYGYTFTTAAAVCNFLLSYGAWLESQGLTFTNTFNNYTLNWEQMCKEFLYFSAQGWTPSTIINLNPCATQITATQFLSIVDTVASTSVENMLLNQNRQVLNVRDLVVNRDGNTFSVTSLSGETINYLTLKFTNFEDMIVLNNVTQYNDLIYDPVTAARQIRLQLVASTTTEWDGQLNAQGFILNLNNVQPWQPYTKYTKGVMVLYKNTYWQAVTISEPQAIFNYNDWVKSDYQLIGTGLLPNLANKADQLVSAYDVHKANLTSDNDLFAFGLIGFRPRKYMSEMNLNDVTQVQIYQQFLGTKGTLQSAEIFKNANLGKESGQYSVYENWGILSGTYGAQANKSFVDLQLNEALLQYNPSTIQIVEPGQASSANQQIYVKDLWKESYAVTSPDILPTVYESTSTVTALPSAGYVSLDDVDVTVFSIEDPTTIEADISNIGIGTYIWIAKVNTYDWGVYRVETAHGQMTQLSANLGDTASAQFTQAHGLAVGDLIIIKYFNQGVNGVYRVLSVPTPTTILLKYSFAGEHITSINGTGLVFKLQDARVAQASDIATLDFVNNLIPGSRVWVDNDGSGHWATLEKQSPFSIDSTIIPGLLASTQYGASVSQSRDVLGALVGAPNANSGSGEILAYYKGITTDYTYSTSLIPGTTDIAGYGNAINFGNKNWAFAGASASLSNVGYTTVIYRDTITGQYAITQLLLPPDLDFTAIKFGSSVVVSLDERWAYVTASAGNKVYAYTRVDVENQTVRYTADSYTTLFNYSDTIQIDYTQPNQLVVMIDNYTAAEGVDYTVTQQYVVFNLAPTNGQKIIISRRVEQQLDHTVYPGIQQNLTTGYGYAAIFSVTNTRGSYYSSLTSTGVNYSVGEMLTIYGNQIGGTNGINNLTITVTSVDTDGGITGFTQSGSGVTDTRTFALNEWLYNATSIDNFAVKVNDVIQRPYYDYTFDPVTTNLTFDIAANPAPGADIKVTTPTYWQYVDTISSVSTLSGDKFGSSITTSTDGRQIIVGAPGATADTLSQAGKVYVFDRSVLRYTVSTPTQMSYTVPGSIANPVSVSVNNTFLLSTDQSLSGQYSLSGNTVTFTNITLNYGDVIEIETNQFTQIAEINSATPTYEAAYGYSIDACPLNCSFYVGAPLDSSKHVPQAGLVEHLVNQSRVYGVTTTTNANPVLTAGGTLRINDIEVTVPNSPNNTVAGFAAAINALSIPNVAVSTTPDLTFVSDGVTKVYNIGSLYSVADSYNAVVYVDNALQTYGVDYSYDPSTENIYFVYAPSAASVITVVSGRLTFSVVNAEAAAPQALITVLPGVYNSVFDQLGFNTYILTQQIVSPAPTEYGQFGNSVSIDTSAVNLVVGAVNGNVYEPTTFDAGNTYFDEHSTTFYNPINNGGVAYTYDYFPSSSSSINNPGQFAFGQQIYNSLQKSGEMFGIAVNYVSGRLVIGATGGDTNNTINYGYLSVYDNPNNTPAWKPIKVQQPVVDVHAIDGVFAYNGGQAIGVNQTINGGRQTYFDFIDPLQGKILGVARQNIDYIGAVDPAQYNTGTVHNNGNVWGAEHIGEMWWDTDTVRFIDPNQDDITYASRRWGSVFPGSSVDVYQWVESSNPPTSYNGSGTPLSTVSYTVSSALGPNNIFQTVYYFWVRGITSIANGSGKTLSAQGVSNYITDPRSSGLPYIAGLNASTIAIYNARNLISDTSTILSLSFDRQLNDDVVHQEYQIITAGDSKSFLNTQLYRKLQDSLCGIDTVGNAVPDPILSPGMRYGVQFRPRQSMFADRFGALENYLTRANTVLAQYPISETRSFNLLNASQPKPEANTGAWDKEVPNLTILSYQNFGAVPVGYKYLVDSDSSQAGRWSIYEVTAAKTLSSLQIVQIQDYDTPLYWHYVNWYLPGYNSTTAPVAAVQNYSQLSSLSYELVPVGSAVRVVRNGAGKWEIYLRTGLDPFKDWQRVGLEDGTIAFNEELWDYTIGGFGFDSQVFDSQYFDETPQVETRYIIRALNEEIYIEDLLYERNSSLILLFNYIYSEFTDPSWLIKTSYVNVNHNLRSLQPYQTYLEDNQTFIIDYFQEVKPYHVQVRNFNLIYTGDDEYFGDVTDYDLPAYWNTTLTTPQFTSPILNYIPPGDANPDGLPYNVNVTPHYSIASDVAPDAQLWQNQSIYGQWFNNYLLTLEEIVVARGGTGYTVAPTLLINGVAVSGWEVNINSLGEVISITPGINDQYYINTPVIVLDGGNGTGAVAVPVMGNGLVRSIKTTIKYDRYQYSSTISEWTSGASYTAGTQVRYFDKVWEANTDLPSLTDANLVFDPDSWTLVDASTLSGVDRTMGYYIGTANLPGLSLPLLIDGIDYPGVQVAALNFNVDPGFDRAAFDITPYDNLFISPTGSLTYDPGLLDTIFASSYLDPYLGTRATDINVAGGAYVDVFESHAPEELVPGIEFDTLDLRVYTTPGADWLGEGHGFPEKLIRHTLDNTLTISFANVQPYPATILVVNETSGTDLHQGTDYTVDWTLQTITLILPAYGGGSNVGDQIGIYVYEVGGGNQLYKQVYNGADVGNSLVVPVEYDLLQEFAIFVNGVNTTEFNYVDNSDVTFGTTLITFDNIYTINDFISLVAIGPTTIDSTTYDYSWSLPVSQTIAAESGVYTYDLTNSLEYTNPAVAVVTVNGKRVTTAAGIDHAGSGSVIIRGDVQLNSNVITNITTTTISDLHPGMSVYGNGIDDGSIIQYIDELHNTVTLNKNAVSSISDVSITCGVSIFDVPQRLGVEQSTIISSDIVVYINEVEQDSSTYTVVSSTDTFIGDITINSPVVTNIADTSGLIAGSYVMGENIPTSTRILSIDSSTQITLDKNALNTVASLDISYETVVTFDTPPAAGARIYISATSGAKAIIDPNTSTVTFTGITFTSTDIIDVTTFNDTREQRLITNVFVGPETFGIPLLQQGFDTTGYDQGVATGYPGSFDYSESGTITGDTTVDSPVITNIPSTLGLVVGGTISSANIPDGTTILSIDSDLSQITLSNNATSTITGAVLTYATSYQTNNLYLGRIVTDSSRLWVSLNGRILNPGVDFTVSTDDTGSSVVLATGILSVTDVVMVTQSTESVVPEAMEFRIFQDMRGVQATYRITPQTTTTLVQDLSVSDDIIYVDDANALTEPNFDANIWGVITINGERIMYRYRDTEANTVSSLLRGTAGTGAADHTTGSYVYDMGRGNLMPAEYQNYIDSNTFLADGVTTRYTADNISLVYQDAQLYDDTEYDVGSTTGEPGSYDYGIGQVELAVEVYVGGIRQYNNYSVQSSNPVIVAFDVAPAAGSEVLILVRRGVNWYQPGVDTPSNGVPLQETNTAPALFLRGLI